MNDLKPSKKRDPQRKKIILGCSTALLFAVLVETALHAVYGPIPPASTASVFDYEFRDIKKPFFLVQSINNERVYVPVRTMNCAKPFSVDKNPGTVRIFLAGGSFVADWDPTSLERQFNTFLREYKIDKSCEVINCGMAVYDSYRIYLVVDELLRYQPDCIIVLSGNNEYIYDGYPGMAAGVGTVLREALQPFGTLLEESRTLKAAYGIAAKTGMRRRMAVTVDERTVDIGKKLNTFKKNIDAVIRRADSRNIPLILGTLPVNLGGIPPSGKRPIEKSFLQGCLLLEDGALPRALDAFKRFVEKSPDNPFGHYYLGKTYEKMHDFTQAHTCYYTAATYDKAVRVNPEMNEYVRAVCRKNKIGFVDIERQLYRMARNDITGSAQFRDDCHIWPDYYRIINTLVCRELGIDTMLFSRVFKETPAGSLPFADTAAVPAIDAYYYPIPQIRGVWEIVSHATAHGGEGVCESAVSLFEAARSLNPNCFDSIQSYKERIRRVIQNDFHLRNALENDATYDALWPLVLHHIGELFRREREYASAARFFDASVALDGTHYLPYLGRALLCRNLKKTDEMWDNLRHARKLRDSREIRAYTKLLSEKNP